MTTLTITHNAGFFSNCSVRLTRLVEFYDRHQCLPDTVDCSRQFEGYKSTPDEDLCRRYFRGFGEGRLAAEHSVRFHWDDQFTPYERLDFEGLQPFLQGYFTPTAEVMQSKRILEQRYGCNASRTAAVFYRGNDKWRETKLAPYDEYFQQAELVLRTTPGIRFFVQTDELEFRAEFCRAFPNSFYFDELPVISRNRKQAVDRSLPLATRPRFGVKLLAVTLLVADCAHVITHSGNCGLWAMLYRGNCHRVRQYLNGKWIHVP